MTKATAAPARKTTTARRSVPPAQLVTGPAPTPTGQPDIAQGQLTAPLDPPPATTGPTPPVASETAQDRRTPPLDPPSPTTEPTSPVASEAAQDRGGPAPDPSTTVVEPTSAASPEPAAPEPAPTGQPDRREVVTVPLSEVTPAPVRTAGESWRAVGARVLDHPGFAPELLALAAVDALGPRAADWVRRTRETYPAADADGLARLATRRFVRLAGAGGALAAAAGLLAPAVELTAVLWTQANLVLHLAAVHGHDPADPDRVPELLVLTQVHPDVGTARSALAAVRSVGPSADGPGPRAAEAAWRLATPLAAQAGGWLGLRLASRLLPGAAVLTAAAGDAAATQRLAARAIARYRPDRGR
ncbi:hypothetical protein [Micromonospora sp. HK10]|uniref:hypothetical protein n=1 Tax=Micromonospora sp. HK10 TaxID=1538294 RepID=UPI0006272A8A|nr:hypothetical protein [Micromonospora sp. HK10]KKK05803.1 hypothetical protein LQ51_11675 [Micromonospora sp. HK10]